MHHQVHARALSRARARHPRIAPYELPEIIALPVEHGFENYLGWVTDECKPDPESRTDSMKRLAAFLAPCPRGRRRLAAPRRPPTSPSTPTRPFAPRQGSWPASPRRVRARSATASTSNTTSRPAITSTATACGSRCRRRPPDRASRASAGHRSRRSVPWKIGHLPRTCDDSPSIRHERRDAGEVQGQDHRPGLRRGAALLCPVPAGSHGEHPAGISCHRFPGIRLSTAGLPR